VNPISAMYIMVSIGGRQCGASTEWSGSKTAPLLHAARAGWLTQHDPNVFSQVETNEVAQRSGGSAQRWLSAAVAQRSGGSAQRWHLCRPPFFMGFLAKIYCLLDFFASFLANLAAFFSSFSFLLAILIAFFASFSLMTHSFMDVMASFRRCERRDSSA
jgi:hypothetical protein